MGKRRIVWGKMALQAYYKQAFPSHPKCRIYYWYDEKELHITGLRFTMMK